jgi:hypothetical protein
MPEAYVQDSLLHVYNLRFLPCCYYDRKLFLLKKQRHYKIKLQSVMVNMDTKFLTNQTGRPGINTFLQLLCL